MIAKRPAKLKLYKAELEEFPYEGDKDVYLCSEVDTLFHQLRELAAEMLNARAHTYASENADRYRAWDDSAHYWGKRVSAILSGSKAAIAAHAPEPVAHGKSQHKRLVTQGAIEPSVPLSKLKELHTLFRSVWSHNLTGEGWQDVSNAFHELFHAGEDEQK